MRIETLTIALLATLAIACVPPQNKTPKKQSSSSVTNGAPHMPDDRLSNNAAANNSSANNESNNISSNNMTTGPGPVCGDGVVEGDESCDGELDVTCEDLGFDGGFTACSSTCAVDTTGCTRASCGDGIVQEGEVCDDGPDNGGYDACSLNCSGLDEYCGDGVVNGPEACDGGPPVGTTCRTLGFDGGTLGCSAGCGLDTSSCTTCGDGVVEGSEICDDGALNGTYGNCNAICTALGATCGDGVRNGPEPCDGADLGGQSCGSIDAGRGTLSCTSSCVFDTSACSLAPAVGNVIVTEVMQNPAVSLDADGEYFELYNTTSGRLELQHCTVQSSTVSGPESFVITSPVSIPAGGYVVFARSSKAPFAADYVYNGKINLNNSTDDLSLWCPQPDGTNAEIDHVGYDDGLTFPNPEGASMSLDPSRMTATQNDLGSNWCESTTPFGVGDLGTPGAPNDPCF